MLSDFVLHNYRGKRKTTKGVSVKTTVKICALCIFFSCLSMGAFALDAKFSGYVFGDYYWMAKDSNPVAQGNNGFWVRRVYATGDFSIVEKVDARLRLEFSSPDFYATSANAMPFIKDAYLKWTPSEHGFLLGISPTPTWEVFEGQWGYRSVEKTPLDLNKFGSSRDFGLAAKGSVWDKKLSYHLMVANGEGTKSEFNGEKSIYLSLTWRPLSLLLLEAYGDYHIGAGRTDRYTLQGFVGIKGDVGRAGVLFAHQLRQATTDLSLQVLSVYGVLNTLDNLRVYGRVDRNFDPIPGGASIAYLRFNTVDKSTFFLGGVDYEPWSSVHFMPNVEVIVYDAQTGTAASPTIVPRLTFLYEFKG